MEVSNINKEIKKLIKTFSKKDLIVIFSKSLNNKTSDILKIFDSIHKTDNLLITLLRKSHNQEKNFSSKLEQIIKI